MILCLLSSSSTFTVEVFLKGSGRLTGSLPFTSFFSDTKDLLLFLALDSSELNIKSSRNSLGKEQVDNLAIQPESFN
jgi:hypothetical protein